MVTVHQYGVKMWDRGKAWYVRKTKGGFGFLLSNESYNLHELVEGSGHDANVRSRRLLAALPRNLFGGKEERLW